MNPKTIRNNVRVSYLNPSGAEVTDRRPPNHSVAYNDEAHAIEITFAEPLERFQRVRVQLMEGISALDGQPLKPWSLTFTTGR